MGGLGLGCCDAVWRGGVGWSGGVVWGWGRLVGWFGGAGFLRQPRSDLTAVVNCAKMAEEALDDDKVPTLEQAQNTVKDLREEVGCGGMV